MKEFNLNKGFSLIEVLISLAVLSLGVWGFLNLDRTAQQWLNDLRDQRDEQVLINDSYELLHQSLSMGTPCSLCNSIAEEFHERFPNTTLTISMLSSSSANIKICHKTESCQNILVQV